MFRALTLGACLIAMSALTGAADAASFNCGGKLTKTEAAICHNSQLSHLDSKMAGLYHQVLNSTISSYGPHHRYTNQFRSGQVFWLSSRNGCGGNFNCLWTMYMNRIGELQSFVGQ